MQESMDFTRRRLQGVIDVTQCFESGCEHGEKLLDFITQNDCRKSGVEVLERCLHFLRKISRIDGSSLKVEHPADIFVVC